MTISNCYLVPVSPDPESAKGLVYMIHSAEKIRKYLNALIFCAGVVICRYDKNYMAHTSFVERIKNIAKKAQFNVCKNIIPTSASIPAASIADSTSCFMETKFSNIEDILFIGKGTRFQTQQRKWK